MGIEYFFEPKQNHQNYQDLNYYCKYQWRNINWREVFLLININLDDYYNQEINWIDCSVILTELELLISGQTDWRVDYLDNFFELKTNYWNDILNLTNLFRIYVSDQCKIVVF